MTAILRGNFEDLLYANSIFSAGISHRKTGRKSGRGLRATQIPPPHIPDPAPDVRAQMIDSAFLT